MKKEKQNHPSIVTPVLDRDKYNFVCDDKTYVDMVFWPLFV